MGLLVRLKKGMNACFFPTMFPRGKTTQNPLMNGGNWRGGTPIAFGIAIRGIIGGAIINGLLCCCLFHWSLIGKPLAGPTPLFHADPVVLGLVLCDSVLRVGFVWETPLFAPVDMPPIEAARSGLSLAVPGVAFGSSATYNIRNKPHELYLVRIAPFPFLSWHKLRNAIVGRGGGVLRRWRVVLLQIQHVGSADRRRPIQRPGLPIGAIFVVTGDVQRAGRVDYVADRLVAPRFLQPIRLVDLPLLQPRLSIGHAVWQCCSEERALEFRYFRFGVLDCVEDLILFVLKNVSLLDDFFGCQHAEREAFGWLTCALARKCAVKRCF